MKLWTAKEVVYVEKGSAACSCSPKIELFINSMEFFNLRC